MVLRRERRVWKYFCRVELVGWLGVLLRSATSLVCNCLEAGRSFKLVEHSIEHGECPFGDEVPWQSAELVGEVLDVAERAEEAAGKTC